MLNALATETARLLNKGKHYFVKGFQSNDFEKAAGYFYRLIAIDPAHGDARRILGLIHKLRGEYEIAVIHLNQALLDYNKDVEAYMLLAEIKGDIYHQHEEAIKNLNRVLDIRPNHSRALLYRAWNKSEIGQYQEAIADLTQAIDLKLSSKDLMNAYRLRGQCKEKTGDAIGALEDHESCFRLETAEEQAAYQIQQVVNHIKLSEHTGVEPTPHS